MKEDDQRILIPCEAKSMGGDAITLNQIVGITAAALQRLLEEDMRIVIPIGAKIEANGDIFVARFPSCRIEDLLVLSSKLKAVNVLKMVRYQLEPKPPRW